LRTDKTRTGSPVRHEQHHHESVISNNSQSSAVRRAPSQDRTSSAPKGQKTDSSKSLRAKATNFTKLLKRSGRRSEDRKGSTSGRSASPFSASGRRKSHDSKGLPARASTMPAATPAKASKLHGSHGKSSAATSTAEPSFDERIDVPEELEAFDRHTDEDSSMEAQDREDETNEVSGSLGLYSQPATFQYADVHPHT